MVHAGQQKKARYWGKYTVKKVAHLERPIECSSQEIGKAYFSPTLVKIEWETSPSDDKNEFWFPYWITIGGKEKYGQFAPMIGENALLELLREAISLAFFSDAFLRGLAEAAGSGLNREAAKE